MNSSESLDKLAQALVKAQEDMPAIPMDGLNPYFKSKYATLGNVIATTRPILAKYGLAVTQMVTSDGEGLAVGVNTVLVHESGQWIESSVKMKLGFEKNAGQEAGALISYLRRYALSAILNVYADEDVDGNQPSQNQKPQNKQEKQSPKVSEERPYSPEVLKEKLQVMTQHVNPASDKQRKFLAILLGQEIADNDIRHDAQEYLFGARSLNDVDGKMVNAALKWLSPEPDSGGAYVVSELAKKELSGVQSAFLMSKGQQKMDKVLDELGY